MNDRDPRKAGPVSSVGSGLYEVTPPSGWAARLDLVPRLQAIVDELDLLDADVDVPRTIAAALLEDVELAVREEVTL
jgi:hypothetical protein